ncbi:unnamed protein product [Ceutorhynchus assimilis]|uniref:Uncharacterized protein n=1 Tax=Ceutorhynchus assimilis TaxID=467358 RepID=A0A9N9MFB8_9CUCU|nr:unnamed protein product [Ceutorhynchus assimilis]
MGRTVLFGIVAVMALAQIYNANAQEQPQPQPQPVSDDCKQKIFEQLKNTDLSAYKDCFNMTSLQDLKGNSQILSQLFTSLPDGCKNPMSSNIKDCVKSWFSNFKNHSAEVQASIAGSINTVFAASKGCISQAAQQLSDLNIFVTNGCQQE